MRALAWILFAVGTGLAAAFGAKLRPEETFGAAAFFGASWWPFWGGVVLATAGAFMLRRQIAAAAAGGGEGEQRVDLPALRAMLAALSDDIGRIEAAMPDWDDARLLRELDDAMGEGRLRFTEARGVLAGKAGVAVYAEVMTRFATGERKLNRAWTALVDERGDEARPRITEARRALSEALDAFPTS